MEERLGSRSWRRWRYQLGGIAGFATVRGGRARPVEHVGGSIDGEVFEIGIW